MYPDYGGRGITFCNRWQGKRGYERFLNDMGPRPSDKHSLDRKNNDRGYSPSNCRWATRKEQNNNRRKYGVRGKDWQWVRVYKLEDAMVCHHCGEPLGLPIH